MKIVNIELSRVFGILLGVGTFVGAIVLATKNPYIFLSLSSFILVVGGILGASFLAYKGRSVVEVIAEVFRLFGSVSVDKKRLFKDIELLIKWSKDVKDNGISVLDDRLQEVNKKDDSFFYYGLELLTSGYKGEELRRLLKNYVVHDFRRLSKKVDIVESMVTFAPAFGMVGTIVGLILMLDGLDADPSKIGKGLSVALITTLYGVLLANLLFKPVALKLEQKNYLVNLRNTLLVEGLVMLSHKEDPIMIQDKLNSYMDSSIHFDLFKDIQ
jgi:chemotaxis protein MotA